MNEPTFHRGLKTYERGTVTWLNQTGHWHVTVSDGRRWIKTPVEECPEIKQLRPVR